MKKSYNNLHLKHQSPFSLKVPNQEFSSHAHSVWTIVKNIFLSKDFMVNAIYVFIEGLQNAQQKNRLLN